MKTKTKFIYPAFATLALACFALSSAVEAVTPAPDGGYPGGNTAEGQSALLSRTTGGFNTAVGYLSLRSDTTGSLNTAIGAGALLANTADSNTATGAGALLSNTIGTQNTANGAFAQYSNITGDKNTANRNQALINNTAGIHNIAVGFEAGYFTTGSQKIAIGNTGNDGGAGESHTIRIGESGTHTATYIAGIAGQTVGAGGSTCYVDNAGKLGVFPSARRFKTDIADMAAASEAILALRPVTFHYKPELDTTGIPQFGLVAEEVANVNPDLVTRDRDGKLQTVRYEAVNVMLLNEFLKEHRKVEEQACEIQEQRVTINKLSSAVAQQQEEMKAFAATLKEQASQIQRVSAQVEVNRPASQTVLNND
jgi:uncharacterized coiled-coil protein SlyX